MPDTLEAAKRNASLMKLTEQWGRKVYKHINYSLRSVVMGKIEDAFIPVGGVVVDRELNIYRAKGLNPDLKRKLARGLRVRDCESLKISKQGEVWSERKCRFGEINKATRFVSESRDQNSEFPTVKALGVEMCFSDEFH